MLGRLLCRIGIHKNVKVYLKRNKPYPREIHCIRCKRILTKRLK